MIPSIFSQGNTQGVQGAHGDKSESVGLSSLFSMLFAQGTQQSEGETLFNNLSQSPLQNVDTMLEKDAFLKQNLFFNGKITNTITPEKMSKEKTLFSLKTLDKKFEGLFSSVALLDASIDDIPEMEKALDETFETLQETLAQLRITLSNSNDVDAQSTNALENAYKELGIPPEEAKEMAERVEKAFQLMQTYMGIEPTEQEQQNGFDLYSKFTPISSEKAGEKTSSNSVETALQKKEILSSIDKSKTLSTTDDLSKNIIKGSDLIENTEGEEETLLNEKAFSENLKQKQSSNEKTLQTKDVDDTVKHAPTQNKDEDNLKETRRTPFGTQVDPEETWSQTKNGKHVISIRFDGQGNQTTTHTTQANTQTLTATVNAAENENQDADLNQEGGDPAEALYKAQKQNTQNTTTQSSSPQSAFNTLLTKASVTAQTSVHMRALTEKGGGDVKFKLHPEELGEVEIELEIRNGRVRGSISVERAEIADHLARELHKLQQGLEDAGLSFSKEGIDFYIKDENPQQEQDRQPEREDGQEKDDNLLLNELEPEEQKSGWINPESLVDISA